MSVLKNIYGRKGIHFSKSFLIILAITEVVKCLLLLLQRKLMAWTVRLQSEKKRKSLENVFLDSRLVQILEREGQAV